MPAPKFQPLAHQKPVLDYFMHGGLRAVLVWHRRSGKDLTMWNYMWVAAQQKVGTYYYFYPTYAQAKKAIWYGITEHPDSTRYLDYIPSELIVSTHDTDMRIHFTNGSIIQLIGSDNVDSIMSTNPIGCVFSEYALQDPAGWRFVSPILAKNGGWACFPYTPRGHNHGYDLYNRARSREGWYTELLTVDDTKLITHDAIEDVRASGVPEEIIQQEFWCSFSVTNEGSYFGQQMLQAEQQHRIREVVYNPRQPVHTAWDFGVNDSCAIWFFQTDGRTIWLIDFTDKANNEGLPYFARLLQERGYIYGTHLAPHDVIQRSFGHGDNTLQAGLALGVQFIRVPPEGAAIPKREQHQAGHFLIPRCIFDAAKCERGIEGLKAYEREWDPKVQTFKNTPKHNWASHIADAFMTLACGIDLVDTNERRYPYSQGAFNPRDYEKYAGKGFDPRDWKDGIDKEPFWESQDSQSDERVQIWSSEKFIGR